MKQRLLFDKQARESLLIGIEKVASAVRVTLGAAGKNVIIDGYQPQITKDGVTVARSIELEDQVEQMGARLLINVAQQVNDIAGDGTTTATILAHSMYKHGINQIENGVNPSFLKRELDEACAYVVGELDSIKKKYTDIETLRSIAKVSSNGDDEISNIIIGAIQSSGDGIITITESPNIETVVTVTDGMQFSKGFIHPYFANQKDNNSTILTKPFILLANIPLRTFSDVQNAMQVAINNNRPLLIIANDFSEEIIRLLLVNKVKGVLECCAVKSPAHGELRRDVMGDIQSLIGGTLFDSTVNDNTIDITERDLGSAEMVTINNYNTVIVSNEKASEERVEMLRSQISSATNEYDKSKLKERLSKLIGGVTQIKVGGVTEIEVKEKKDRYEDSLNATRAAMQDGVIPGGGITLYRIAQRMKTNTVGRKIMKHVIEAPFNQICTNAGFNPEVVFSRLKRGNEYGFNVATNKCEDMFKTGILDPVKVPITALNNVTSIIGLLLTTDCVVFNLKENEK